MNYIHKFHQNYHQDHLELEYYLNLMNQHHQDHLEYYLNLMNQKKIKMKSVLYV